MKQHEEQERGSLSALFEPRSIAVIGASDDGSRIGGRPLRFLANGGFAGPVYPVNPNRATVQGLRAYPTLASIPHDVDLAIIALPSERVLEELAACAEKGVRGAIVFSSGFAEASEEGAAQQREMRRIACESGMRILGPNCLGAFNTASGFFGTFSSALDDGALVPGPISIASQSGACGGHLAYLCKQRSIGVHHWITTGNEADVDLSECVLWLAQSDDVKVILVYAEAIRDGATFLRALEIARSKRKPVIMLKVGRTSSGARAAASHTGALAGEDAVYDAVLRQYGVFRAESIEQMLDVASACAKGIYPPNPRLGIITASGGLGVQMSDAAEVCGLEITPLAEQAQARIKEILPFAATGNPIDMTAQVVNDMSLLDRCVEITLSEGDYGAVICFLTSAPAARAMTEPMLKIFSDLRQRYPERLIVLSFAAPAHVVVQFEQAGFLVFEDVNRAVTAIGALAQLAAAFSASAKNTAEDIQWLELPGSPLPAHSLHALDEYLAKNILASAGIPVLVERLARDPEGVRVAAKELGCPVVLKIVSPNLAHKTEVGGVILNLPSPEAAASAAAELLHRIAATQPDAQISGLLVAPMCKGGVETICGVFTDPVFGPVVMFGLGGVHVEIMRDVVFRLAPFSEEEALAMVKELRGYGILQGARGAPPSDVQALTRTLSCLSRFAAMNRDTIAEIDINPFVVMPRGQGAFALDALIVPHAVAISEPPQLEHR